MEEFNYVVYNEVGQVLAVFTDIEDALIFIKASFEKYYAEPTLNFKLTRFEVEGSTSIRNTFK